MKMILIIGIVIIEIQVDLSIKITIIIKKMSGKPASGSSYRDGPAWKQGRVLFGGTGLSPSPWYRDFCITDKRKSHESPLILTFSRQGRRDL